MIMRSLIVFLCLIGHLLIVISGAVAEVGKEGVFRVGAIVPLTGPLADYGVAVQSGFEFARRDHPEMFKNIEFVFQDSRYEGMTALNAFNTLSARGDIDLYYVWGVTPNESLLPVLEAKKLPVISETTLKASLVGKPLAIRAAPTGDMTAKILSEELLKRGSRSIGMLLVDIPYYRDIVDALTVYLERGGAKLEVVGEVTPDTSDFKSMIAKIRAQRHDAIGIFLLNDQVISYYRQALALRFALPTFGASIHDSQELIDRAGPGAEGALLVGYDVTPDFRARWLAALDSDARTGCGANAYDTAFMIAELFGDGASAGLSGAVIAGRFASISRRHGVSGEFGFAETQDGGKHFDFPISARVIRDGKIQRPDSGN